MNIVRLPYFNDFSYHRVQCFKHLVKLGVLSLFPQEKKRKTGLPRKLRIKSLNPRNQGQSEVVISNDTPGAVDVGLV